MKTIKVIDLLNKIANGEDVPEKIKDDKFELKFDGECYEGQTRTVLNDIGLERLNDEVEIIEDAEEDKEIKKIKITYDEGDVALDGIYLTCNHSEVLANKLNEVIDVVNKLNKGE